MHPHPCSGLSSCCPCCFECSLLGSSLLGLSSANTSFPRPFPSALWELPVCTIVFVCLRFIHFKIICGLSLASFPPTSSCFSLFQAHPPSPKSSITSACAHLRGPCLAVPSAWDALPPHLPTNPSGHFSDVTFSEAFLDFSPFRPLFLSIVPNGL